MDEETDCARSAPSGADSAAQFVTARSGGRAYRIEYAWVGAGSGKPVIVFLHEGLGSRGMWRDFPDTFCRAGGFHGLVYSRPGYGWSTPRPADEHWPVDFMHIQAREMLPAVLNALGLDDEPVWLFGHSDGASIALLAAAALPARIKGLVLLAPHVFVEEKSLHNIRAAREAYLHGDLRVRLARYHADPDSAFFGWNDIWLAPTFRAWDISDAAAAVRVPILAVQGLDDPYGTMAHVERIAARAGGVVELLPLETCAHSPHRDQTAAVIAAASAFIRRFDPAP